MGLGSNQTTPKIYLSVAYGKIRQKSVGNEKVNEKTPGAVKRLTQQGAESWSLEHDFVTGEIENIFYKEDEKYGNSFEVVITEVADKYQLSFTEDSRFWFDFAKKLPNINFNEPLKITAYDFTDRVTGKKHAGISVEQNGQKITSFYETKEGEKWILKHGFPTSEGVDWKDKDETKVFLIRVKKFLRTEFVNRIMPLFAQTNVPEVVEEIPNEYNPLGNLPEEPLPF